MQKVFEGWVKRYLADEEAVVLVILLATALIAFATIGSILVPLIAALIFAFLLQGIVTGLNRLGLSHLLSVLLTFTLFVGLLAYFFIGMLPLVVRQATNLLNQVPGIFSSLQKVFLELPEKYPQFISPATAEELTKWISEGSASFAEHSLSYLVSSLPGLLALVVYLVLVPFLVFFMLKDKDELLSSLGTLFPKRRIVMLKIWDEMNVQLTNYVRGKAIEILVVGATTYIVFLLLGVNYAALLALLVGLSVIIPYVGAMLVTIPVVLVGFFQWGWSTEFFWLFVCYGVIQVLDGNVLVPVLFSEAVNLHPILIILAVLFFGGIWGIWGVFFAIPLATLVKVLYNTWPRTQQESQPTELEQPAAEDVVTD